MDFMVFRSSGLPTNAYVAGAGRYGSSSAPANTSAGHLTVDTALFTPAIYGSVSNASGAILDLRGSSHATTGPVRITANNSVPSALGASLAGIILRLAQTGNGWVMDFSIDSSGNAGYVQMRDASNNYTGLMLNPLGGPVSFGGVATWDANQYFQGPNDSSKQAKAQAWNTYSDARIKEQLRPIGYGLAEIMRLQPQRYFQRDSRVENGALVLSGGKESVGLVAQEVWEVVPEIVTRPSAEAPSTELWGLEYAKVGVLAIAAIQELLPRIEALEGRT